MRTLNKYEIMSGMALNNRARLEDVTRESRFLISVGLASMIFSELNPAMITVGLISTVYGGKRLYDAGYYEDILERLNPRLKNIESRLKKIILDAKHYYRFRRAERRRRLAYENI